jgi:hypothetical protein
MRPIVILLVAVVAISVFGLSGYALGEILDEFSPNNTGDDKTSTIEEKLDVNPYAKLINWKNDIVIDDQNFSAK